MLARTIGLVGTVLVCLWALGCTGAARVNLAARTGGNAALFGQFQAYDGHTGRPISFARVVRHCAKADVILVGEQHSDVVCNQLEAQLLYALASDRRPVVLAMEFFEVDTQAALDAYLAGRIDEAAYRKQTRQGRAYVLTHRPLLELCRAARIPVLAANAPRRLVRAYRKSGLDYEAFRATVEAEDHRWLPVHSMYLAGPYKERFFEIMSELRTEATPSATPVSQPTSMPTSAATTTVATTAVASQPTSMPILNFANPPAGRVGESVAATQASTAPATTNESGAGVPPSASSQPASAPATQPTSAPHPPPVSQPVRKMPVSVDVESFYRAQLLWDQAMSDALADFRERFPTPRVILLVGGFHVAHEGGTATKLRRRRPNDRFCTVVYRGTEDDALAFDEEDRHAGDVVIYGIVPPPPKKRPAMPTTKPATTMPGTTRPATAPASSPASAPTQTGPGRYRTFSAGF